MVVRTSTRRIRGSKTLMVTFLKSPRMIGDHAATTSTWRCSVLGGPADDETSYYAGFPREMVSPLSCPDNSTFDNLGATFWISTDGSPRTLGITTACTRCPSMGKSAATLEQGYEFGARSRGSLDRSSPDNTTLFVAIQHPGEGRTFEEPAQSTGQNPEGPARPALVVLPEGRRRVIGT